jgi:hypothetical protein
MFISTTEATFLSEKCNVLNYIPPFMCWYVFAWDEMETLKQIGYQQSENYQHMVS